MRSSKAIHEQGHANEKAGQSGGADVDDVFEGMTVEGVAKVTIANGKIAWNDGDLRAVKGAGRYVDCPPYSPVVYEALNKVRAAAKPVAVDRF